MAILSISCSLLDMQVGEKVVVCSAYVLRLDNTLKNLTWVCNSLQSVQVSAQCSNIGTFPFVQPILVYECHECWGRCYAKV